MSYCSYRSGVYIEQDGPQYRSLGYSTCAYCHVAQFATDADLLCPVCKVANEPLHHRTAKSYFKAVLDHDCMPHFVEGLRHVKEAHSRGVLLVSSHLQLVNQ